MCVCDPLRFTLSFIFENLVSQFLLNGNQEESVVDSRSEDIGTCLLCSTNEQRLGIHNPAVVRLELIAKIDQCIKLYKVVNITQRTTLISEIPSLSLTFTPEYLKLLTDIWSETPQNTVTCPFVEAFEQSLRNLFRLQCRHGSAVCPLIVMDKDQYMNQQVMLDRVFITNQCIRWGLNNVPIDNPKIVDRNGSISIGMTSQPGNLCTNPGKSPMTQYRKMLVGSYINQVCRKVGYKIDSGSFHKLPANNDKYTTTIFIVNEASQKETDVKNILVLRVGDVLTMEESIISYDHGSTKLTKRETIESFYMRCLQAKELKSMENPNNSNCDSIPNENLLISNAALVQAAIKFDLLNSCSVTTQLELQLQSSLSPHGGKEQEHGSFIILYNYSRLISILRKFAQKVSDGHYPPIAGLKLMDFSKLEHETEIALVQMLLDWPRVLENTIDFTRQEVNIGTQLKFIKELAYRFNSFYTLIAVLAQPSSPHEFSLMFMRIYFLRAIRNIFHDFFQLMLIEFDEMESKL